jgi:hypothetical protein
MTRVLAVLAALTLFLGSAGSASASFVVYHDQASFLAAISPNYFLNTFPNANGFQPSPQFFLGNGQSYSATTPRDFYSQPNQFSTDFEGDPITFNFLETAITAVGGNFYLTDFNFNTGSGTLGVFLNGSHVLDLVDATPSTFLGLVSDTPITSLTLVPSQDINLPAPLPLGSFATVSNLIVDGPPAPEPTSLVLALFGAAGLGAGLRRRERLVAEPAS